MSFIDNIVSTATSASSGFPWGAAIAGGLSYLGQSNTNQANADIAAQNNTWSAQQYATRYQTQVKDMQAAGLNPMLSYNTGAGAAPTAQTVQFQNALGAGVNSGLAGYTKKAELDQIKAQTGLTDDTADKTRQDMRTSAAAEKTSQSQEKLNDANVLKTIQDIKTGQANANAANSTAAVNMQEARMRKLEADLGDKLGVGLKAAVPALSSAASAASRVLGKSDPATINKTFNYGKK
jgi:hypothetical protein